MGIVIGILILSVMMIVHELGHFLTGRALGFTIEEFSIFMGPKIFSTERNGIRYSLRLLPIGASVSFAGEYEEDGDVSNDPGAFFNRPKWARAIVIATGPALNLLSGILAFLIMFTAFGFTLPIVPAVYENTQAAATDLKAGDRIIAADGEVIRTPLDYGFVEFFHDPAAPLELTVRGTDNAVRKVAIKPIYLKNYRLGVQVKPETQQGGGVVNTVDASSNGGNPVLQPEDILLAANGAPYSDREAFSAAVAATAGKPFIITVIRQGQQLDLTMSATEYNDLLPRGVYFTSSKAFFPAVEQAVQSSWSIVKLTVKSIGRLISGDIAPRDSLAGPVGVVTMISDTVTNDTTLTQKVIELLWMFALISVSLGFMNLLPIPPLDGNHLVLIGLEGIRGKRLSPKVQSIVGVVGITLIIMLALAGLFFDILRLTGR